MVSELDGFRIEQTTFEKIDDLQYRLDGAPINKKKPLADLQRIRSLVEEVRCHVESFRGNLPTYDEQCKDDLREGFASFLELVQDATKIPVKMRCLGLAKSVAVTFNVVDEILQTKKTKFSHAEPDMNLIEQVVLFT